MDVLMTPKIVRAQICKKIKWMNGSKGLNK